MGERATHRIKLKKDSERRGPVGRGSQRFAEFQTLVTGDPQSVYATIGLMKSKTVVALILLLLIPVVVVSGGWLFSQINPESAAGHPNYARNFQLLSLLQHLSFLAMLAVVAILWLVVCFLVIQAKQKSLWWLLLAALGPVGFAILATLRDKAPAETDRHERFVRKQNWFVRLCYRVCTFAIIWVLADQVMIVKRNLMIAYESATTGVSKAQIIDLQNASSGMWAFGEGIEVMYMVVFLYLIWPMIFNIVFNIAWNTRARNTGMTASPRAR